MLEMESGTESFSWARHKNVECVRHLHAHLEIVIVTEGELNMKIGNADYAIKAGQGVFISAFEPHEFVYKKDNRCTVLMFSRELMADFFALIQSKTTVSHIFAISNPCNELLESLLVGDEGGAGYFSAQALLSPLCLDILRGCEFADGRSFPKNSAERAFEYISAHFSENLSLGTVARAVGLHPVTLSKMFSGNMGVSFVDCLGYIRCKNAAAMIKSRDITFTEVAMACGFGSVRSFNRNFRSVYGVTPTEYKRQSADLLK